MSEAGCDDTELTSVTRSQEVGRTFIRIFRANQALRLLAAFVLLLLAIAIVVGLTTLAQLGGYKREVAKVKNDITAMGERISRLENDVAQAVPAPPTSPVVKSPSGSPGREQINLSAEEISLIRNFIKLPPAPSGATGTVSLGDHVPAARLMLLPDTILDKVPKLRGARFAIDKNQAIVVVGGGSNRVDAIIAPN